MVRWRLLMATGRLCCVFVCKSHAFSDLLLHAGGPIISTVVGNQTMSANNVSFTEGPALGVALQGLPSGIVFDVAGNLFISGVGSRYVYKVSPYQIHTNADNLAVLAGQLV